MERGWWWVLALAVAAAFLAGCGGDSGTETVKVPAKKLQPLEVSLDRPEGPENVGILMAEQRGYFADVGLDVELTVGLTPAWPIRYVTDRAVDIALSPQPQVVMAKEKGLPIVAVGTLMPQSTSALIWLERSRIDGIADLKGKTIAVPGLPFQRELLKVLLTDAGLAVTDVKIEKIREAVKALTSGEVDAIFSGTWNVEGAELEARGLEPVITRVQNLGVPAYDEHVVVVRSDRAAKDPQLIHDFMSAVARGTTAAVEDPEDAVEVIEESPESSADATPEGTRTAVEATLPLLSRTGYMSPGRARKLVDWMLEEGMIQRKLPVSALQTNAYQRAENPQRVRKAEKPRKASEARKANRRPSRTLRHLNVTLDGWEGPENMGIVVAVERGYFEDAGLDVGIVFAPASPLVPVKYVAEGVSDIAITHQPQVAVARAKGAPVIAVDALVRKPTASMIWLKRSKIDGIADLKGKTIAIPGLFFQREFLKSILRRAGLTLGDVKVEFVRYDLVSSLVNGDVDAIFGGSWNVEGVELEKQGLNPVITRAQDLGLPPYDELVLIVRSDHLSRKSKWIRAFTSAVARGTAAAIKDPKDAVKAIEESYETNPEATPKATKAGVKATIALLSKSGYMSPEQARKLIDWMFEEGMIQRKPWASALQTNAYR